MRKIGRHAKRVGSGRRCRRSQAPSNGLPRMKKEVNRSTPTGAPTRPKQPAQEKGATTSFTASAYWKFESIPLQRRVRCEPVSRENSPSYVEKPRFPAGVRAGASGAVDRDAQGPATSR